MGDGHSADLGNVGGYRIRFRLGWGGMGEVYLANATGLQGVERPVAIKMIRDLHQGRPELAELFVEEAKVSFLLTHPNIVQTYEIGQVDGHYFLVMEYVDGITLEQLLGHLGGQPVPVPFALYIGARTARALDHAHTLVDQHGTALHIVHRDVSPGNILLSRDGQVKLADFGLAKSTLRRVQSEAGLIKGKLAYMAPEQLRGDGEVGPAADIYALGVVLHEMLSGENPFGELQTITLASRNRDEVPSIAARAPHLQPEAVALVERCLRVPADKRFASARELGRALDGCLQESGHAVSDYELAEFIEAAREEAGRAAPAEPHPFDLALGLELEKVDGGAAGVSTFMHSPAETPEPAPGTTVPPVPIRSRKPWIIAGLALLLVAAGGVWLAAREGTPTAAVEPAGPAGRSPASRATAEPGADHGPSSPPAPAPTGTLQIRPRPAGGEVRVAGRLRGTAPLSLTGLPAGRALRVQISLPGHRPYDQQVTLDPGGTLVLEPRLARVPRPAVHRQPRRRGWLSVNSEPWSLVYVDGAKVRATPLLRHPLPAGTHRVRLYNPTRKLSAVRKVRILPDRETRLSVELGR